MTEVLVVGPLAVLNQYRYLIKDDDTDNNPVEFTPADVIKEAVGVPGRRGAISHCFTEPQQRRLRKLLIANGHWGLPNVVYFMGTEDTRPELPSDWRYPDAT